MLNTKSQCVSGVGEVTHSCYLLLRFLSSSLLFLCDLSYLFMCARVCVYYFFLFFCDFFNLLFINDLGAMLKITPSEVKGHG